MTFSKNSFKFHTDLHRLPRSPLLPLPHLTYSLACLIFLGLVVRGLYSALDYRLLSHLPLYVIDHISKFANPAHQLELICSLPFPLHSTLLPAKKNQVLGRRP